MAAMVRPGVLKGLARIVRRAAGDLFDQSQPFGRLAVVHSLQGAGTTLITISLAGSLFFSISPHAAEGHVLLYLLLTIAPFVLVGPALSPLLDRGRQARRTSVAVANGGSALVCMAMANDLHDVFLFPEAFGVLVLGKLYLVGRAALVPAMIGDGDDLASANARLAVLASLAGFAAFPGGVLVLKIGAAWDLRMAAVVFLAGTLAALRLPRRRLPRSSVLLGAAPPTVVGARDRSRGKLAPEHQLFGLGQRTSGVVAAISAMSVARACVGFVELFLAFGLRRAHAGTWWFGLLLVASGAGSLIGSLAVPRLRRFLGERQIIEAALAVMAVGALAAATSGGLWAQAMLTFVVGVGPTCAKPALDSIVQRNVPSALLGRTFGRLETRLQLVWVVAALVGVVVPLPLRLGDLAVAVVCGLAVTSYAAAGAARRRVAPHSVP